MQQDVHDSVEDAMAALELYQKADEMIQAGTFDAFLNKLYEFGQRTDWISFGPILGTFSMGIHSTSSTLCTRTSERDYIKVLLCTL